MDSASLCSDMQPGDSKWSITIWARNAETGMAKWVYPIEPHCGSSSS
jgi:glucose dehydrogenase